MEDKMMDLLDDVGWTPQYETGVDPFEWKHATFKWMTEVSNRILEIDAKIVAIERGLRLKQDGPL